MTFGLGLVALTGLLAVAGCSKRDVREDAGPSDRTVSVGPHRLQIHVESSGTPTVVMDAAEEYQRYWVEQSRALAAKSTASKFVLAEEASHYLYLDVPDLVAESILSVVHQAREK